MTTAAPAHTAILWRGEEDAISELRAAALAALASLERLRVPPEPAALAVLCAYHLRRDGRVRAALDPWLAGSARPPLPAGLLDELHRRCLAGGPPPEAGPRLEAAAAEAAALAGGASGEVGGFGRLLGETAGRLEEALSPAPSPAPLAAEAAARDRLLAGLLRSTRHLAREADSVSARLAEMEAAMGQLRAELAEANRAAMSDHLTGLANRRAFDSRLGAALAAAREGGTVSVLILDIDHFKRVNDSWGHAVGDAVIRSVAARLRASLREGDAAARLGGEEFGAILPDAGAGQALGVAERVRAAIAEHELTLRSTRKTIGRVTVSCGVAERRPGEAAEALMARADAALYAAKRAGRDRAVAAPP